MYFATIIQSNKIYGYIQSIHITNFIKIFINNFVELCTFGKEMLLAIN